MVSEILTYLSRLYHDKEVIMPRKDLNVLGALTMNIGEDKSGIGEQLIHGIQSFNGKPFVLLFQEGTDIPEITKITYWYLPIIIINALTPEDQAKVNADVSTRKIINDPELFLFKAFGMSTYQKIEESERHAYIPQAFVCRSDGDLQAVIQNQSGETATYFEKIKNETLSLKCSQSYLQMTYRRVDAKECNGVRLEI